jgi:hypothetical protein
MLLISPEPLHPLGRCVLLHVPQHPEIHGLVRYIVQYPRRYITTPPFHLSPIFQSLPIWAHVVLYKVSMHWHNLKLRSVIRNMKSACLLASPD